MPLFSIGYATKAIDVLVEQLQQHEVHAVADIRSVPYSKTFPEYHREALQATLKKAGIQYVYLGQELGPRSEDPAHYDESGQVQFDRLMRSDNFLHGIERLKTGLAKDMNIALLCAEKDPAICHRSLLVGHYLQSQGLELHHITHDGQVESHGKLEQRLVEIQGLEADLLTEPESLKELAFKAQVKSCAYRKDLGKN